MPSFLPVFTPHPSPVHDSFHEHERVFLLVKQTKITIEASSREATLIIKQKTDTRATTTAKSTLCSNFYCEKEIHATS